MKRLLSSVSVFKKCLMVFVLTFFNLWAIYEAYNTYNANARLTKQLEPKPRNTKDFQLTVSEAYKKISDLVVEKDSLLGCNQSFVLLEKTNDKTLLAIDYYMAMRNDFGDTMKLLDELTEKKLIFRISELSMERKDERIKELDINLRFRVLAYEKNT